MAKRTISKSDENPTTPTRRRKVNGDAAAAEMAPKAPRLRRKVEAAPVVTAFVDTSAQKIPATVASVSASSGCCDAGFARADCDSRVPPVSGSRRAWRRSVPGLADRRARAARRSRRRDSVATRRFPRAAETHPPDACGSRRPPGDGLSSATVSETPIGWTQSRCLSSACADGNVRALALLCLAGPVTGDRRSATALARVEPPHPGFRWPDRAAMPSEAAGRSGRARFAPHRIQRAPGGRSTSLVPTVFSRGQAIKSA